MNRASLRKRCPGPRNREDRAHGIRGMINEVGAMTRPHTDVANAIKAAGAKRRLRLRAVKRGFLAAARPSRAHSATSSRHA